MEEQQYKSKIYFVTMSYDVPQGGSMRIPADNEEQVRTIFTKQFGHYKNFEIIQIIAEEDIKPTAFGDTSSTPMLPSEEPEDDNTPPSQKVH